MDHSLDSGGVLFDPTRKIPFNVREQNLILDEIVAVLGSKVVRTLRSSPGQGDHSSIEHFETLTNDVFFPNLRKLVAGRSRAQKRDKRRKDQK
jgi:hypothetical protein